MRILPRRTLLAVLCLALAAPAAAPAASPANGLKGEYFANTTLSGAPAAERVDPAIDFAWEGVAPAAGLPAHRFSVRWTGTIRPLHTERYTLITRTDDGVRLWIDGRLVIDDWAPHAVKVNSAQLDLVAGHPHAIRMEFYEEQGRAEARLRWKSASQEDQIVPSARLAPPVAGEAPGGDVTRPPVLTDVVDAVGGALGVLGAGAGDGAGVLPPPAPPVAGQRFNAAPAAGEVLVRRPGDGALLPLEAGASLPVGTRLDTRSGAVVVETAPAAGFDGDTQSAAFEGATFRVTQPARGARVVGIDLAHGDFESCPRSAKRSRTRRAKARARKAAAGPRRGRDRQVRRLFGKGKGRFRTKGRFAAATVRGTAWTVADTCDETVARVHEGVVDVEDLATGRTVVLEAGERYAARRRGR